MTRKAQAQDPAAMRQSYGHGSLRRAALAADPLEQFRTWFEQAVAAKLLEPNAMVLSTCDHGQPSSRTVLLKAFDARGYVFFTNYGSRKARAIDHQPQVSLLFPWYGLERQLLIEGRAERISAAESLAYFSSRPFGSRLGAWVSQQSQVIPSRAILEQQWQQLKERFRNEAVPLPPAWGGLRVLPQAYEFWQGGRDRLHDRFRYRRQPQGPWLIERLAP